METDLCTRASKSKQFVNWIDLSSEIGHVCGPAFWHLEHTVGGWVARRDGAVRRDRAGGTGEEGRDGELGQQAGTGQAGGTGKEGVDKRDGSAGSGQEGGKSLNEYWSTKYA